MAYEIVLKKRFTNKLVKLLAYLEKEWSHKVAANFLQKVDLRIQQLSKQPFKFIRQKLKKRKWFLK